MSDAPTVHALVSSAVQARQTGDLLFAAHCYEQALELAPDQVDIRLDAAAARLGSGDPTKAIELLGLDLPQSERPAPLPPSQAWREQLLSGMALARLRKADDALICLRSALSVQAIPATAAATARKECASLLLNELGDAAGAAAVYLNDEMSGDGSARSLVDAGKHLDSEAWLAQLISGLYTGDASSVELVQGFRAFASTHLAPSAQTLAQVRASRAIPSRGRERPRVGLISPMFSASPVAFLTLGAIEALSKHADLVFLDRGSKADWAHARYRQVACEWHDLRQQNSRQLVSALQAADLDVVVDLCGWMDLEVLKALATRPVRRQFKWVGGQSLTTGLECFDGFLADRWQVPDAARGLYSEQIFHFSCSYVSYTSPPYRNLDAACASLPVPERARPGAYAIVSNPVKICRPMRQVLDQLLPKVQVLYLVDHRWRHRHARDSVAQVLGPWMSAVRFIAPPHHPAYLDTLARLDATFLDTQPYSMGLTAIELRLLGKPILVWPRASAATMRERHCVAHLQAARLDHHEEIANQLLAWCRA
jgi:hypothetical protein